MTQCPHLAGPPGLKRTESDGRFGLESFFFRDGATLVWYVVAEEALLPAAGEDG